MQNFTFLPIVNMLDISFLLWYTCAALGLVV